MSSVLTEFRPAAGNTAGSVESLTAVWLSTPERESMPSRFVTTRSVDVIRNPRGPVPAVHLHGVVRAGGTGGLGIEVRSLANRGVDEHARHLPAVRHADVAAHALVGAVAWSWWWLLWPVLEPTVPTLPSPNATTFSRS